MIQNNTNIAEIPDNSHITELNNIQYSSNSSDMQDNGVHAMLYGQPLTNLPKDLYIPPNALEVFLNSFEGPLDLLLYLIRKQGINILDIQMAPLTQQYLEYVEQIRHVQFELAAEYLLMAAMLIEIKTRMLLPKIANDDENDEEDPRAELIRKLISYEAIKKASLELQELPICNEDFWLTNVIQEKISLAPIKVDVQEIVNAFKDLLKKQNLFEHHQIIREQLSVREYMSKTLKHLQINKQTTLFDLINMNEIDFSTSTLVVYFLAILELVKEGLILFKQSQAFAPIYLDISYEAS
ncbi:MAG: hypothetical protein RLZZ210_488 [Pseudomonadota bacterium]|jgi:segregation and condensation protein A